MCLFAVSFFFSSFSLKPQDKLQEHELLCLMTDTRRQGNAGLQYTPSISYCVFLCFLPACTDFLLQMVAGTQAEHSQLCTCCHSSAVSLLGRFLTNPSFCFLSYFPASLCTQEVRRSEISAEPKSKKL